MSNQVQSDGKRVFDDAYSFPQDSQDLADDIFANANVRVGTSAERQALPVAQQRVGMLWVETDTGTIYRNVDAAGDWSDILGGDIITVSTFSTGWDATNGYPVFIVRSGKRRQIFGAVTRSGGGAVASILTVPEGDRPSTNVFLGGQVNSSGQVYNPFIQPNGLLAIPPGYNNVGGGTLGVFPLGGSWWVA